MSLLPLPSHKKDKVYSAIFWGFADQCSQSFKTFSASYVALPAKWLEVHKKWEGDTLTPTVIYHVIVYYVQQ